MLVCGYRRGMRLVGPRLLSRACSDRRFGLCQPDDEKRRGGSQVNVGPAAGILIAGGQSIVSRTHLQYAETLLVCITRCRHESVCIAGCNMSSWLRSSLAKQLYLERVVGTSYTCCGIGVYGLLRLLGRSGLLRRSCRSLHLISQTLARHRRSDTGDGAYDCKQSLHWKTSTGWLFCPGIEAFLASLRSRQIMSSSSATLCRRITTKGTRKSRNSPRF